MSNIGEIDKNLAVSGTFQGADVNFYNVRQEPFTIYGLVPSGEGEPFRRLPLSVAEQVNEGVLRLHIRTAGGRVRFRTNSGCVAIRAIMPNKNHMPHMPFLGSSGFDLYEEDGGKYIYRGSFVPPVDRADSYESIIKFSEQKMRDLTINFPLYDGVDDLYIGIEPGAELAAGGKYALDKPVIFYGSSITQGGCASRPGNCYSNIITRSLNIDHVNLGFSGSARGEKIMAEYIIKQPMSLFFCDYDHNAPDVEHLARTHEAFFLTIRDKHPNLPIIMASRTDTPKTTAIREDTLRRRDVVLRTYVNALKRGDEHVKFIDGTEVFKEAAKLGVAADSCTVDGVHPNDLGFACMAKVFGDAIAEMIR